MTALRHFASKPSGKTNSANDLPRGTVKRFLNPSRGKTLGDRCLFYSEHTREVARMFPIDGDMFAFLWSTCTVLFASKSQLRKNSKPIPVRYQRQLLEDSHLTEEQRKFIAPLDAQLAALGYLPFYTLRVTNYGSNLVRGYQNHADPASCTLTIVEVKTNVNG